MLLILTALTFFVLGRELTLRLWRPSERSLDPLERIVASCSIGFSLWIGTLWIAALSGLLSTSVLATRNILGAIVAALLWFLRWRKEQARLEPAISSLILAVVIPLALWSAFILWRGWIVPPLSHDALAYHLPKAALYVRAQAYDPLPELPQRARNIPVNYELLLADTILTGGDDRVTEWHSLLHYLFFVVAAVSVSRRWWGANAPADTVVALLIAAVPVALLHSGAHKNDLLTSALLTASFVWIGRFFSTGELRSIILAIATVVMATGTKPQAGIVGLVAIPIVIERLRRHPRFVPRLTALVGWSAIFLVLLGPAYWLVDRLAARQSAMSLPAGVPVSYGDWQNFWLVPYTLLAAPFSTSSASLWVPWSEGPWFWRRYEIFFSELGIPFAVCALVLPIAAFRYWNSNLDRKRERVTVSVIAFVTFLIMLPVTFRPIGFYAISAPRYVLFVVPIVFGWTIALFLRQLESRMFCRLAMAIAVTVFSIYAMFNAIRDLFVPIDYVLWAAAHTGTRHIPFDANRAASIVDRFAGNDAVAIEAADATWLYPAFGAGLSRPVQLLPAGAAVAIAPSVRWVVIDRKFEWVWKHPRFENLSETRQFLARGGRSFADDPLFQTLSADERWRPFYIHERTGQAIFVDQRVSVRNRRKSQTTNREGRN